MVSSFLPYPLYTGGHIRLYNLIKHLSKTHEITLICQKRDYQTKSDIEEVAKICDKVIATKRKKQWSLKNILKTGFSTSPFLLTGHRNPEMKREIKYLLDNEKFDLIHVETFYVMQNLPATQLPIVLVEHNVEYLVYKRFADRAPLLLKPLLYIDVLKLKYWEEKMWKRASRLVAVSEIEKKIMSEIRKDVVVVSNGVDTKQLTINNLQLTKDKKEKRILFIGDFKWLENRDAVEWILTSIWPLINLKLIHSASSGQNLKLILWIVGKEIPEKIKSLGGSNIILDENAPKDTKEIFNKSYLLFAPIRIGGGTSFKILEAMAAGTPVITTQLGNEGIGASVGEEILIAKDASDFAQKTLELLENSKTYEKISENARKFIEENYDWEKIVKKLEAVYKSVIL